MRVEQWRLYRGKEIIETNATLMNAIAGPGDDKFHHSKVKRQRLLFHVNVPCNSIPLPRLSFLTDPFTTLSSPFGLSVTVVNIVALFTYRIRSFPLFWFIYPTHSVLIPTPERTHSCFLTMSIYETNEHNLAFQRNANFQTLVHFKSSLPYGWWFVGMKLQLRIMKRAIGRFFDILVWDKNWPNESLDDMRLSSIPFA